jgi:RNA polymerase sigma-70 factor (ECF subfamily)
LKNVIDDISKIIEGCKRGNRNAQEKLYNKYSKLMFGLCLRYSNNYDEAKDILHEGFIRIFKYIDQLRDINAFEAWMKKIMVNSALEKYRNKMQTNSLIDAAEKNIDNYSIEAELSEKELLKMVQELSPQYRLVFNLYAIEGYSHKEISDMLNISEGTSKSNLSRARAILQEKIKSITSEFSMKNKYE